MEHGGNGVNRGRILDGDHGALLHAGEEGNFAQGAFVNLVA